MTYTVTLDSIREHGPCESSWTKLLKSVDKTKADNTEVSIEFIFNLLGLDDTLWALRALPADQDHAVRLLVCDLVEPTLQYTDDPHPAEVLRVARAFARGEATAQELSSASTAARNVAWGEEATAHAASAAAWAAEDNARNNAWNAAQAASAVVSAAAWAAELAKNVSWSAARVAAVTAYIAARAEQKRILSHWLKGDES